MKNKSILILAITCLGLSTWRCSDSNTADLIVDVTQEQLDVATILPTSQDSAILGDPFNGFPNDTVTTKHKLRDLFASISKIQEVKVGTIMVRRAYYYPWSGRRDSLLNVVVMVKREAGYFPEGGDWEYMNIKYNKDTNYELHPNGILPDISNTALRGQLVSCANCHAGAGNKFLFHRDR